MTVLRTKIYPHLSPSEIPDPVDFYFERWWGNPLFRGSYSNWPASFFEEHHEDLVRMVGGRVGFAGEHTSAKHFGSCRPCLSRFCRLWRADGSSRLKGSCMGRISLALGLRTRYVIFSCAGDACNSLSLRMVASELVRRRGYRMSRFAHHWYIFCIFFTSTTNRCLRICSLVDVLSTELTCSMKGNIHECPPARPPTSVRVVVRISARPTNCDILRSRRGSGKWESWRGYPFSFCETATVS